MHTRDSLNELYSLHTGQSVERIRHDTERDNYMSPTEAISYGLIDTILQRPAR